jgi:hypothetical protein
MTEKRKKQQEGGTAFLPTPLLPCRLTSLILWIFGKPSSNFK